MTFHFRAGDWARYEQAVPWFPAQLCQIVRDHDPGRDGSFVLILALRPLEEGDGHVLSYLHALPSVLKPTIPTADEEYHWSLCHLGDRYENRWRLG